jgi:hypothetical protein
MSGSKVLEGFGRLLVLAVGPNSQQGMIQAMVMHGSTAAAAAGDQQEHGAGSSSSSSSAAAAVPMLREATPLTSRLEDVAGSIGGVGLAAAVGVLAVNSGLYTAEVLAAGGSLWSSASLEVRQWWENMVGLAALWLQPMLVATPGVGAAEEACVCSTSVFPRRSAWSNVLCFLLVLLRVVLLLARHTLLSSSPA